MTFKKHFILKLMLLFQCCTLIVLSQTANLKYRDFGQPFIKYYSPKEYKSDNSNWSIVQDRRGVMYFGNSTGILEFDGNTWRKIEVPYSSLVRSLAIDDQGIIYVCASSDFGYLEPDSIGQLKYKSLKSFLDPKYKSEEEFWDVIVNSKGVYFKTDDQIFKWNGKDFKVLDSVYSFRFYKIGDAIYARNNGTGLGLSLSYDVVNKVHGGELKVESEEGKYIEFIISLPKV